MELLKLIFKNVFRHKLRAGLTILGVAIAMLAFCMLRTLVNAWYVGAEASSPNRLVTRNKISLVNPLPIAHRNKIIQVSGVTGIGHGQWFGGIYKEKKNFFGQFAVSGSEYVTLLNEFVVSDSQKKIFDSERSACIAGRRLAKRFGWKIGEIIPLKGTIFPVDLELVLRGIYRGVRENADETALLFRYDYLNEKLKKVFPEAVDKTGWFLVQIKEPERAAEISQEIDSLFRNSLAETLTETEKAFQMGFIAMTDAIVASIQVISVVVVGIIMIVLANTMAMTARERSPEYAVLKTLGFRPWFLLRLISGESVAIALIGGTAGIIMSLPGAQVFHRWVEDFLPVFQMEASTLVIALAASLMVGIAAALPPALRIIHTPIADGLRHMG